jgi:hypothetical protein
VLGAMFNYLVAIFYRRPIRQGLFGRPIFRTPLDRRFWWMGLAAIGAGLVLGITSLLLGLSGWPLTRLWLWQLLGAMSILVGVQLVIGWFIMRVLEELSQRQQLAEGDMPNAG